VRLIDGNTSTYLSVMDFEFISRQSSFSLLGLVADDIFIYIVKVPEVEEGSDRLKRISQMKENLY